MNSVIKNKLAEFTTTELKNEILKLARNTETTDAQEMVFTWMLNEVCARLPEGSCLEFMDLVEAEQEVAFA